MSLEIRPIMSALLRNRASALLVGLQIAITLAVVSNAAFIIQQRLDKINRPTGIDAPNMFYLYSYGYTPGYDAKATLARDIDVLRRIPGVIAVSSINSMILSGGGSSNSYNANSNPKAVDVPGNYFEISEQGLDALGVKLIEGRNFRPEEMSFGGLNTVFVKQVIISQTMAMKLFGTERALGRLVYNTNGEAAEVIGVSSDMMGSWVDARHPRNIVYHPVLQSAARIVYVVRTQPGQRDESLLGAQQQLTTNSDGRFIVWTKTQEQLMERSYQSDHRMVVFLWTLIILLTGVTALGIVGLATYLVNARRKQIGTRRALGARRVDVLRYFMVENGLLTLFGVVTGTLAAFAFSFWLSAVYELPALPLKFVLWGIAGLLVLGQLAVLVPARRAASVPPAVATRTV